MNFYTTRKTKAQIMENVPHVKSRLIARNTVEYTRDNGDKVTRYHLTDVHTLHRSGRQTVNTGGYPTKTTKDRINGALEWPWHVYQENSVLWISTPKGSFPLVDNTTFTKTGNPTTKLETKEAVETRVKADKRAVSAFVREFWANIPEILEGTTGDPWTPTDDRGLYPETSMRSWLQDKYCFTSFLKAALKHAGYPETQFGYVVRLEDHVKRSIRKLAMASLGYSL